MQTAAFTDLFSAGTGFDVAGAYLLARGLLVPSAKLADRIAKTRNTLGNLNVFRAEDRANGEIGVASLCFGFFLQAVAYTLEIGGLHAHTGGGWAAAVSVGCAIAAIATTATVARAFVPRRTRKYLIDVARWDKRGRWHELPDADELYDYGQMIDFSPLPDEFVDDQGLEKYAKRVFGLDRVRHRRDDRPPR
jgi:hypothetical protein